MASGAPDWSLSHEEPQGQKRPLGRLSAFEPAPLDTNRVGREGEARRTSPASVFGGESFVQLVEGAELTIQSLLNQLKADTRRERREVLHVGPSMRPRRFPECRLGYLLLELHEFGIASLRGKRGSTAMDDFKLMLPALNIEAGHAVPKLLIRRSS